MCHGVGSHLSGFAVVFRCEAREHIIVPQEHRGVDAVASFKLAYRFFILGPNMAGRGVMLVYLRLGDGLAGCRAGGEAVTGPRWTALASMTLALSGNLVLGSRKLHPSSR